MFAKVFLSMTIALGALNSFATEEPLFSAEQLVSTATAEVECRSDSEPISCRNEPIGTSCFHNSQWGHCFSFGRPDSFGRYKCTCLSEKRTNSVRSVVHDLG